MTTLTRTAWGLDLAKDDQIWRQNANCGPAVADWFWLVGGSNGRGNHTPRLTGDNKAALALCDHCPVLAQCLADELAHPTPYAHIGAGRVWTARDLTLVAKDGQR